MEKDVFEAQSSYTSADSDMFVGHASAGDLNPYDGDFYEGDGLT